MSDILTAKRLAEINTAFSAALPAIIAGQKRQHIALEEQCRLIEFETLMQFTCGDLVASYKRAVDLLRDGGFDQIQDVLKEFDHE